MRHRFVALDQYALDRKRDRAQQPDNGDDQGDLDRMEGVVDPFFLRVEAEENDVDAGDRHDSAEWGANELDDAWHRQAAGELGVAEEIAKQPEAAEDEENRQTNRKEEHQRAGDEITHALAFLMLPRDCSSTNPASQMR